MIGGHSVDGLLEILNPSVRGGITVGNFSLCRTVILAGFVFAVCELDSRRLTGCLASGLDCVGPCVLFNVFGFLLRLAAYRANTRIADYVLAGFLAMEGGGSLAPIRDGVSRFGDVIANVGIATFAGIRGIALLRAGGLCNRALKIMRGIFLFYVVLAGGFIPMPAVIVCQRLPKVVTARRQIIVLVGLAARTGVGGVALLGARGVGYGAFIAMRRIILLRIRVSAGGSVVMPFIVIGQHAFKLMGVTDLLLRNEAANGAMLIKLLGCGIAAPRMRGKLAVFLITRGAMRSAKAGRGSACVCGLSLGYNDLANGTGDSRCAIPVIRIGRMSEGFAFCFVT